MKNKPNRQYPALYEKGIPIAIGIILFLSIALLVFTILIVLGYQI